MQRHVNNYTHTVEDKVPDGVVKHDDEHTQEFLLLRKLGRANLSMSWQVGQDSDGLDLNFFILGRK